MNFIKQLYNCDITFNFQISETDNTSKTKKIQDCKEKMKVFQETYITSTGNDQTISLSSFIDMKAIQSKKQPFMDLNSRYQGCNAEKISSENTEFILPRSLTHLFFIYFALKHYANYPSSDKNPFMQCSSYLMDSVNKLLDLSKSDQPRSNQKIFVEAYRATHKIFNKTMIGYLNDKGIDPIKCDWSICKSLVGEIWKELDLIKGEIHNYYDSLDDKPRYDPRHKLYMNFFKYIYSQKKSKDIILKVLETEWSLPANTTLLYRSSNMKNDHVLHTREDFQELIPHSLSFGTSPFSGLIYEGTPSGTCPLVYQLYGERDFYALCLTSKKIARYFFHPEMFQGLIPLFTEGEFSHPRLKVFDDPNQKLDYIEGVMNKNKETREMAALKPGEVKKIQNLIDYQKKMQEIFNKNIVVLAEQKKEILE